LNRKLEFSSELNVVSEHERAIDYQKRPGQFMEKEGEVEESTLREC
jgi:hypothetical protein